MEVIALLALVSVIIFLGVFGEYTFSRTKVPDVLWLVIVGLIAGPILGVVDANALWLVAPFFSAIALMVIMFEGGLHLNVYQVIRNTPTSVSLALAGFIITVVSITIFAQILAFVGLLQNWSLINGLLLGSILGGSSSIIVMPLVRSANLSKRVTTVLSIESATTDVLCVVVTIGLIQFLLMPGSTAQNVLHDLSSSFAIGAVFGIVVGLFWLYIMNFFRKKIAIYNHSYMLTFGCLALLYAITEFVQGSGAIAALAFGVILGNGTEFATMFKLHRKLEIDKRVKEFNMQVSFFVKTFFFALIGMLIIFDLFAMIIGILLAIVIFFVRPTAVKIATIKEKFTRKEMKLINGLVPRGLAAAVLAILPVSMGVPGTEFFSKFVFIAIFATIVITTVVFYLQLKK